MLPEEPIPSVSVAQLAEWMQTRPALVLLDVREPFELGLARIRDPRVIYAPLSRLAQSEQPALPPAAQDPQAEVVVFCHHGIRSVQVVAWLRALGWSRVFNLEGGLEAYAQAIDPSIGFY